MSNNTNVSPLDEEDKKLTKEDHVQNYVKALDQTLRAMEPFREHLKDLKRSYVENEWLSRAEMSAVLKAYRSLKNDEDLGEIQHYVDVIKKGVVV
jgi:hypothetical protein